MSKKCFLSACVYIYISFKGYLILGLGFFLFKISVKVKASAKNFRSVVGENEKRARLILKVVTKNEKKFDLDLEKWAPNLKKCP